MEVLLLSSTKIEMENPAKTTLLIKVTFREGASCHGELRWLEAKRSHHFRNFLEMLSLINQAILSNNSNFQQNMRQWDEKDAKLS